MEKNIGNHYAAHDRTHMNISGSGTKYLKKYPVTKQYINKDECSQQVFIAAQKATKQVINKPAYGYHQCTD